MNIYVIILAAIFSCGAYGDVHLDFSAVNATNGKLQQFKVGDENPFEKFGIKSIGVKVPNCPNAKAFICLSCDYVGQKARHDSLLKSDGQEMENEELGHHYAAMLAYHFSMCETLHKEPLKVKDGKIDVAGLKVPAPVDKKFYSGQRKCAIVASLDPFNECKEDVKKRANNFAQIPVVVKPASGGKTSTEDEAKTCHAMPRWSNNGETSLVFPGKMSAPFDVGREWLAFDTHVKEVDPVRSSDLRAFIDISAFKVAKLTEPLNMSACEEERAELIKKTHVKWISKVTDILNLINGRLDGIDDDTQLSTFMEKYKGIFKLAEKIIKIASSQPESLAQMEVSFLKLYQSFSRGM